MEKRKPKLVILSDGTFEKTKVMLNGEKVENILGFTLEGSPEIDGKLGGLSLIIERRYDLTKVFSMESTDVESEENIEKGGN